MNRRNRLLIMMAGLFLSFVLVMAEEITVQAEEKEEYDFTSAGVAEVLSPGALRSDAPLEEQTALNINQKFENEKARMEEELTMANVKNALNVRKEPSEKAEKVGRLYKDCGGNILERKDGWTKMQSGNVVGWVSDEYLLFGEDANTMAEEVGNCIVTLDADAVRVRK